MKALLLAAILLSAPLAAAKDLPALAAPPVLLDLLPGWLDAADAAGRDAQGAPVSQAAQEYLGLARAAAAQGRFRVALFDLETHAQQVEARRLLDAAAAQGSLARQKEHVLAQDALLRAAAMEDWAAYRERLHALDGRLKSLHAAELALLSADLALSAVLQTHDGESIRVSFAHDEGIDERLVAGLARTSVGVSRSLAWATDVLDAAAGLEGLPPRLDEAAWSQAVATARTPLPGDLPSHLEGLERVAGSARAQGEDLLAVALHLAELRQDRLAFILQQYGDASARGLDVVRDATTGLRRAIENVSVDAPASAGLLGAFTATALDHAAYTLSFADEGRADLPTLAYAWAALDHQARATEILAQAAGKAPTSAGTTQDTPGPGVALVLGAGAAGALALRRRRA